jgi:hypothetical protein
MGSHARHSASPGSVAEYKRVAGLRRPTREKAIVGQALVVKKRSKQNPLNMLYVQRPAICVDYHDDFISPNS